MLISLHVDAIGLYKLGSTAEKSLMYFEKIIKNDFIEKQSTVLLPCYTYSYTSNEVYDMRNSECKVGKVNEFVRQKNKDRRTSDPLFSYLILGKDSLSKDYYKAEDIECFGEKSIFAEMFNKNAFLASLAAPMSRTFTETHYVEKILGLNYRKNKNFIGKTIDHNGNIQNTTVKFFCRDLEKNLKSNFDKMASDLVKESVMKSINFKNIQLSGVYFQDLYNFIEQKVKKDYYYLCESA